MNEPSKRIALEELRRAFQRIWDAGDTLDRKLQNNLNFSSVIVTVSTTILASTLLDKVGIVFWILLLAAFSLYLIMFANILVALRPLSYSSPISQDQDELEEKYFQADEERALEQAIHDHIEFIHRVFNANRPKVIALRRSSALMGAIVVLLVLAVPVGLLFPTPTLPCFLRLSTCVP